MESDFTDANNVVIYLELYGFVALLCKIYQSHSDIPICI